MHLYATIQCGSIFGGNFRFPFASLHRHHGHVSDEGTNQLINNILSIIVNIYFFAMHFDPDYKRIFSSSRIICQDDSYLDLYIYIM